MCFGGPDCPCREEPQVFAVRVGDGGWRLVAEELAGLDHMACEEFTDVGECGVCRSNTFKLTRTDNGARYWMECRDFELDYGRFVRSYPGCGSRYRVCMVRESEVQ